MRASAIISIGLLLFTASCDLWKEEVIPICDPVRNIFAGQWEWVETKGVGLDGLPFTKNPASESYTWKFILYDSHCFSGKLQTYKNDIAETFYIYHYTVSPIPAQQIIELDRLGNNVPEIYSWQIKQINGARHLFLCDPTYVPLQDANCCENLEHHFVFVPGYSERCNLIPDPGPCDAAIPKYYFNRVTGKCEEFTWGGCGGVVPFQTMEECQQCLQF